MYFFLSIIEMCKKIIEIEPNILAYSIFLEIAESGFEPLSLGHEPNELPITLFRRV